MGYQARRGGLRRDHRCASTRRSNQGASQFVTFGPVVRRLKAAASCVADTQIKEPESINAKESTAIPPRISLKSLTGFNNVGVVAGWAPAGRSARTGDCPFFDKQ